METTASSTAFPQTGDSGNSARNPTIAKAAAGAHQAVDHAAAAAKPAVDKVVGIAHRNIDKAADVAAPAADWVAEKAQAARVTQKELVDNTANYVSANPFKSIGIAAAVGFVLGRLIFR